MTAGQFLGWLTALYGLGLAVPLFFREPREPNTPDSRLRWPILASLWLALAGSLVAVGVAGGVSFGWLTNLEPSHFSLPWFAQSPIRELKIVFQIDRLGAFFALIIAGFSALVAVYSFGALKAKHFNDHRHRVAAAFNAFVWSTLLVVMVGDCLSLLVALELMSLSFGYLALFKHLLYQGESDDDERLTEEEKNKRHNTTLAPQVYLMVSHTSTAFLLAAVTILGLHAGGLDFQSLRAAVASPDNPLSPTMASGVFLLALAGLGIRVGLVPAHVWVPLVHPASPTPTHALSLGIAIKVGVYLMIRFFFEFTHPQPWWGYTLLLAAALTALVNVWYAIASHDLKTALAYHSIENIGIMGAGLGVALIFVSSPGPTATWIARLALVASLYHLLNHAVFKGLLYMATGSIDNLTNRTVEFEKLGGLIRIYPWTSAAFIIGALAISGFPPLNGFISEWLTLQSLFLGLGQAQPAAVAVLVGALALLAASFALTAFCFYKMVALVFLGEPRPNEKRLAEPWAKKDSPPTMLVVMGIMALLCLVLGVLPGLVVPWLAGIVDDLRLFTASPFGGADWSGLVLVHIPNMPQVPVLSLILVAAALALLAWLLAHRSWVERSDVWNCGTLFEPATMQYTGAAISELVRRVRREEPSPERDFSGKGPPTAGSAPLGEQTEDDRSKRIILDEWFRMSDSKDHVQWVHEVFRAGYNRFSRWIYGRSERFGDAFQGGDIRAYLRYILVVQLAVMVLFLVLGWRGTGQ